MKRWRGTLGWPAIAAGLVVLAAMTAGPEVAKAFDKSLPKWLIAIVAAICGVGTLTSKPLLDALVQTKANRIKRKSELSDKQKLIIANAPGARKELPRVSEIAKHARILLGIHPAIPLPPGAEEGLSVDLPTYVQRDMHVKLTTWLSRHKQSGGFAMLVGPAASGKTRAAYEAILEALPDWKIFVIDSTQDLNQLLETPQQLDHTVLWMDDAQRFLIDNTLTAKSIRRTLAAPDTSIFLIGTIWPSWYEQLVAPEITPGMSDYKQAQEILAGLVERFDVASDFTSTEWNRLKALAPRDPRLKEASQATGARPTELLAAVPELIRRWEHGGNPYGTALISAAVAARQCGVPEPLTAGLLEELARVFLAPASKAAADIGWLTKALEWCSFPLRGEISPLTPVSSRMGTVDGYAVSDILVQRAETENRKSSDEQIGAVWDICIARTDGHSLGEVGARAYHLGQLNRAKIALERAIESRTPDANALNHLGLVYERQNNLDKAEAAWRKAIELDVHSGAHGNLGELLIQLGDFDEAEKILQSLFEKGDTKPVAELGKIAKKRGDVERARRWWQLGVKRGDVDCMGAMGDDCNDVGNLPAAREWWLKAAREGHGLSMVRLGRLEMGRGDADEAKKWWRLAKATGNGCAMDELAKLAAQEEKYEEARVLWTRAIPAGCLHAAEHLADHLLQQGSHNSALARALLIRPARLGSPVAATMLGDLEHDDGNEQEAVSWWKKGAEGNVGCAMDRLANHALKNNEKPAAEDLWRKALAEGCHHAPLHYADYLHQERRVEESVSILSQAAQKGNREALERLKEIHAEE